MAKIASLSIITEGDHISKLQKGECQHSLSANEGEPFCKSLEKKLQIGNYGSIHQKSVVWVTMYWSMLILEE